MDVISLVNNTTKIVKYLAIFLVFVGLLVAEGTTTGGLTNLQNAMKSLCQQAISLLAVAIILMIVLAAVVYAAGQVMGAETRARATVWATAMLTGAIIGAILYIIIPWLIAQIIGGTATYNASTPCEFTIPGGSSSSSSSSP